MCRTALVEFLVESHVCMHGGSCYDCMKQETALAASCKEKLVNTKRTIPLHSRGNLEPTLPWADRQVICVLEVMVKSQAQTQEQQEQHATSSEELGTIVASDESQ